MTAPTIVHLHAAGVSAVIDLTGSRLPALLHWGIAITGLDDAGARALVTATVPVVGPNTVDLPGRPSLVPEGWTGWLGRPGLTGCRRGGHAWSPRFVVRSASIDGAPLDGFTDGGAALLEAVCADVEEDLWLTLQIEMLPSGLLRTRAVLRNEGDPYDVHDLVLAYPLPGRAREIMDYAGRWAKEKVSQRRPLVVGTHLRENRKGRTGADAAGVLHVGVPGFSVRGRRGLGASTSGSSGNHTHYVEQTVAPASTLLGGGELLLPGELTLGERRVVRDPLALRRLRRRPRRGRRTGSTGYLRARPGHVSVERPGHHQRLGGGLLRPRPRPPGRAAPSMPRPSASSGSSSTTAGSAARRDDRSGLGDWTVSRGRLATTACIPLVDVVQRPSACSSGCGSSPRWSTRTPTSPAPTPSG